MLSELSELPSEVPESSGRTDLLIAVAVIAAVLCEMTLCTVTSTGLLSSTKLDGFDALEPARRKH